MTSQMIPEPNVWNRLLLTRLLNALYLSSCHPPLLRSLLPKTPTPPAKLLPNTSLRHLLLRCTGLTPPPRPPPCSMPTPKNAPARLIVQLVPHDDDHRTVVMGMGVHPYLELVCSGKKRVWHVVRHMYKKWNMCVQLVDVQLNHFISLLLQDPTKRPLDSSKSEASGLSTIRLRYRVVQLEIDWCILQPIIDNSQIAQKKKQLTQALEPKSKEIECDEFSFVFNNNAPLLDVTPSRSHSNSKRLYAPSPIQLATKRKRRTEESPARKRPRKTNQSSTSKLTPTTNRANNEIKVLNNLQNHLVRLNQNADNSSSQQNALKPSSTKRNQASVPRALEFSDSAAIPDAFLRSCSRFDMPFDARLPDSMLSLPPSDNPPQSRPFLSEDPFSSLPTNRPRQATTSRTNSRRWLLSPRSSANPIELLPEHDMYPSNFLIPNSNSRHHQSLSKEALPSIDLSLNTLGKKGIISGRVGVEDSLVPPLLTCDEQPSDLGLSGDNATDGLLFDETTQSRVQIPFSDSDKCSLSGFLKSL